MNFPLKNWLFGWFLANRGQLFIRRSLPLPFATGRTFVTFIALSHYALIADPLIPKNPKIFVLHQFSVKFMSKKADKLKKILVLHPKIRNQR